MNFTYSNYSKLLKILSGTRLSVSYPERNKKKGECFLLRHDIDYGLEFLEKMPSIEASLGIKATYFVQVCSDWYNPFSSFQTKILESVISIGHRLGLHTICPPDASSRQITAQIEKEILLLESRFGKVNAVSFHHPPPCIMTNKVKIPWINTYDRDDMKGFEYISDSCQEWPSDPFRIFKQSNKKSFQLLIHPVLWGEKHIPFRKIARNTILLKSQFLHNYLSKNARGIGTCQKQTQTLGKIQE